MAVPDSVWAEITLRICGEELYQGIDIGSVKAPAVGGSQLLDLKNVRQFGWVHAPSPAQYEVNSGTVSDLAGGCQEQWGPLLRARPRAALSSPWSPRPSPPCPSSAREYPESPHLRWCRSRRLERSAALPSA